MVVSYIFGSQVMATLLDQWQFLTGKCLLLTRVPCLVPHFRPVIPMSVVTRGQTDYERYIWKGATSSTMTIPPFFGDIKLWLP